MTSFTFFTVFFNGFDRCFNSFPIIFYRLATLFASIFKQFTPPRTGRSEKLLAAGLATLDEQEFAEFVCLQQEGSGD